MVSIKKKGDIEYYICDSCGFAYKDKETAQKCEDWCNANHSCNTEITKNAIDLNE